MRRRLRLECLRRGGMLFGGVAAAGLLMGAADGSWLRRVPAGDRAQVSPLGDQAATAAEAGGHLYSQHCATCHGAEGLGKPGRPPVVSDRVGQATDGELAWLMKNGNAWKGMPSWSALPTAQRWQLVAYLRKLNTQGATGGAAPGVTTSGTATPGAAPGVATQGAATTPTPKQDR